VCIILDESIKSKTLSEKQYDNEILLVEKAYDLDNYSFVVESAFKQENAETLGEVLLRLMTHWK
jgi:hypothetical protein